MKAEMCNQIPHKYVIRVLNEYAGRFLELKFVL